VQKLIASEKQAASLSPYHKNNRRFHATKISISYESPKFFLHTVRKNNFSSEVAKAFLYGGACGNNHIETITLNRTDN
jgi:hypothetical protein